MTNPNLPSQQSYGQWPGDNPVDQIIEELTELKEPKEEQLVLTAPWEDFGGIQYGAHICKDGMGFVHLTGLVKMPPGVKVIYGGANSTIATLPAGFRPTKRILIPVFIQSNQPYMLIASLENTGVLQLVQSAVSETIAFNGEAAYLSLASISFLAGGG